MNYIQVNPKDDRQCYKNISIECKYDVVIEYIQDELNDNLKESK